MRSRPIHKYCVFIALGPPNLPTFEEPCTENGTETQESTLVESDTSSDTDPHDEGLCIG